MVACGCRVRIMYSISLSVVLKSVICMKLYLLSTMSLSEITFNVFGEF